MAERIEENTRMRLARTSQLRDLQSKSYAELKSYLEGGAEYEAMIRDIEAVTATIDTLLDHPSVVLDEDRYASIYELRQSLADLRLGLLKKT